MRNLKNLCLQSLGVAALALGMSSAMAADKATLKIGYVKRLGRQRRRHPRSG